MFVYEKKLQYPVRIANPNPKLAAFIISQYGGPDGFWIYKFLSSFCMQKESTRKTRYSLFMMMFNPWPAARHP